MLPQKVRYCPFCGASEVEFEGTYRCLFGCEKCECYVNCEYDVQAYLYKCWRCGREFMLVDKEDFDLFRPVLIPIIIEDHH